MGRKQNSRAARKADKLRKQLMRQQVLQSFLYLPNSNASKNEMITRLGIPTQQFDNTDENVLSLPLTPPTAVHQILGDGNCLFRALSYAVTGSEEHYHFFRLVICDFMETNTADVTPILPRYANGDVQHYLCTSNMKKNGTWGTEVEILVACVLLQTNIYIYSKAGVHWKWIQHSPSQTNCQEGIYLYHKNGNHFEVVIAVENSTVPINFPKDQYYILGEISKYKTDLNYRKRNQEYSRTSAKKKWKSDEKFRAEHLKSKKDKYNECGNVRNEILQKKRRQYSESADIRQDALNKSKRKYARMPIFREEVKEYSRTKYNNVQMFREKVNKYSRTKYNNEPMFRAKVKKYSQMKYKNVPAFRAKVKRYSRTKYKKLSAFRKKVMELSKQRYKQLREFREEVKAYSRKKYANNIFFKNKLKCYLRNAYHNSSLVQFMKKAKVASVRKSVSKSVQTFHKTINNSPRFICCVCIRLLYKVQVKKCKKERYFTKGTKELNPEAVRCFSEAASHECDNTCPQNCWMKILTHDINWICHTCDRHLKGGSVPPQALANNLSLTPVPPELAQLNVLERQLLALRIPFMKMLSLPRGGQKGVKGPIVNVPSDITSITTSLPRPLNDAQLVKVKLKRKLTYKGHYSYQWINPQRVIEALQLLKEINVWYKDINIDESWLDNITDIEIVQQDSVKSESDEEDRTEEAASDQQSNLPIETCFEPIDIGQEVLDTNRTLCIAPGEGQRPQNIFQESGSDAMAFPTLMPDGHFGLFHDREIKLSPAKYFNARLFSADSRFATNKEFIFFAQYLTELNYISSNISLALRKGKSTTDDGKAVTASMLLNSDSIGDILKSDIGYRFLQPVRGTPPYWQRTMKDLYAMIRQLGIPTWFVTFSAAEMRWTEVIQTLLYLNNDHRSVEDVEWSERCSLITNNPVVCARMFDHRVKALFRDLIMSKSAPLGTVTDYFYRTEFQQRGSPHIHCLFWIKNAPKLDQNSDEEVCAFIDKYISCDMPDQNADPELFDIISTVQIHNKSHTKSCKKYNTTCRFNFPKLPMQQTFIARSDSKQEENNSTVTPPTVEEFNKLTQFSQRDPKLIMKDIWTLVSTSEESNLSFDQILQLVKVTREQFKQVLIDVSKANTVYLRRHLSDIWVNNYNPDLSRAWNANTDIQYVTDAYACVAYILSYISKAENEMSDLLQNAQQEVAEGNNDARTALRKLGNIYVQNREVSAQEAIYRVTGLNLKKCTREVVFVPAGSNIMKMSLPISIIKARSKQGGDDEHIWMSSVYEKYYARPDQQIFQNMCLAEFCSKYRFLPKSQNPKSSATLPVFKLKNDLGSIRKRKSGKEAVIRYPRFNEEKNPEEYHLTLAQLYLPHSSVIALPPGTDTFQSFVKNGIMNDHRIIEIIINNKQQFELDVQNLERAWDDLQEGRINEQAWGLLAPEAEGERIQIQMEERPDSDDQEIEEIPELRYCDTTEKGQHTFHYEPPSTSQNVIQEALRSMNTIQQNIFYSVRQWCLKLLWKGHPDPFFVFLTGGAGTGKSHVIRCIYHEATRILSKFTETPDSPTVLLTAPTGTAAFNIQGMTIHSAFAINKNVRLPYQPLGENLLNTLRKKFDSLQILIIDEISMVDQKILTYIHGRLCQIKHCKRPFGNVSVLAVGDFYQLPPVKGLALYRKRETNFVDLWNTNFSKVTLSEVMRQREDLAFAEMLNRLRVHVKGNAFTVQDKTTLRNASVSNIANEEKHMLHIFPTNSEVEKHNSIMIEYCSPIHTSIARDFYTNNVSGKPCQKDQPYTKCAAEDLQTVIKLAIGARVMLTRNIDTDDGLVNGAFGSVSGFDLDAAGQIKAVYILFDNQKVGQRTRKKQVLKKVPQGSVRIQPFQDNLVGKKVLRKQMPLKLAWAATIHKVQGMTVDKIAVSLKKIFQPGMAYVALSRATSLSGLHILDYNEDTIYSSSDITEAIEQMPDFLKTDSTVQSSTSALNIIHHNTEGLLPHLPDIRCVTKFKEADIICFTETWLTRNNSIPSDLFPDHQFHQLIRSKAYTTCNPTAKKFASMDRGGVAFFVKRDIPHKRFFFKTKDIEAAVVIANDTVITAAYRPPSYPLESFMCDFRSLLFEIQQLQLPSVIVGDFNVNVLLSSSKAFVQKLNEFGYTQMIDEPTTEAGTCLDLIFLHRSIDNTKVSILPTYYSFHEALQLELTEQK